MAALLLGALASVFTGGQIAVGADAQYQPAPRPAGLPASAQELPALRTRTSRTYATPGGDNIAVISRDAINYRDDQSLWQPIDNTLVPTTGGYVNRADAYSLKVPSSLDGGVHITRGSDSLSFALQGAGGAASVQDATATYADALPGVSIAYTADNADVKETLTLASPSAPSSFVFQLQPGAGLTASLATSGAIDFRDASGTLQFAFAPAFMRDAAGETHRVSYSLAGDLLTMSADPAWLADPARVYPVVIDPTIPALAPLRDCTIQNGLGANTSYCSASTLNVGYQNGTISRSLLSFDTSAIPRDVQVLSARLNLYLGSETSTNSASLELHRLTQPFTSAATWNKKDGTNAWTTPGGDFDPVASATATAGGTTGTTISWYPTTMVQNWVSGATANNGLIVKQASETVSNLLSFNSSEQKTNPPQLTVWYEARVGDSPQFTFFDQQLTNHITAKVNVANGNLLLREDNFDLAGKAGFDFAFSSWNNSRANRTWWAGREWEDPFTAQVKNVFGDGSVELYLPSGTDEVFKPDGNGGYISPPEVHARLVHNQDGTYTLTYDADGHKLNFFSYGALSSMKDNNGNTISASWSGSPQSVTDSAGRTTSFSYTGSDLTQITDPAGRAYHFARASGDTSLISDYTDAAGKTTHFDYDGSSNEKISKITDPLGNVTEFAYESTWLGRITSLKRVTDVVHDTGPTWTFAYATSDANCPSGTFNVTYLTDPLSHTTTYCSDDQARVIKTIDALGNASSVDYTTAHGGSGCAGDTYCSSTDALGHTTTYSYNANNELLWSQSPLEDATHRPTYAYADVNHPYLASSFTDARGKVTNYSYDAAGNTTQVVLDGTTTEQDVYDSAGQMTNSTDGRGKTTTYTYNADGSRASQTDPLGDKTTYSYDGIGRLLSTVDPLGNVTGGVPTDHTTSYTYNANDQLLTQTDQLGHTTTYAYDGDGNETSVTDANGHTTSYAYDALNRRTTSTAPDPDGAGPLASPETTFAYDTAGNMASETDPRGYTTSYSYDADNRQTSTTTPMGERTTYGYDANGNLTTIVDPRGNVQGANPADFTTTDTYDAAGHLLTRTDPLGHNTAYAYDLLGNRTRVTDANSHVTNYTYDAAGRILTLTAPDGGVTTLTYDGDGNLLTRTDADNHTTSYAYDDVGRLISVTKPDPDGAGPLSAPVTTYGYDANGNRTSMVDANGNATPASGDGTTSYSYDHANRLTGMTYSDSTPPVSYTYDAAGNRLTTTDGAGTVSYVYDNLDRLTSSTRGSDTFSYAYDPSGNPTSRTYPGGAVTTNTYDSDGRLATVASDGATTSYSYDAAGNLTQTTLPSSTGRIENRSYDRAGRLTNVTTSNPGGSDILAAFDYTLDPVGNPTTLVTSKTVAGQLQTSTETYTYDANDRLTKVCYQTSCPQSTDPSISWTYDLVGNRLSESRGTGTSSLTTSSTYNADDQQTTAGSTSYSYDADGNETAAGSRTFSYDLANRLVATTSGATTTTYTYDGDGNRLQASTGSQPSDKTNYLWDTNQALPQLALERDGNNSVLRRYAYGLRRISMTTGGSTYYYAYDRLGSVSNLISSSGTTEWTYTYEPFGALRTQTQNDPQAPSNPMGFTGEYLDSTGDYNLRAREYDPSAGRFLSPDPLQGASDPYPDGSYAYASETPTVLTDPSGMSPCCGIDRAHELSYLRAWAQGYNPAYHHWSDDCTNFLSQAMRAGGWSDTGTWYYNSHCGCNGSAAWNRVVDFTTFAVASGRASWSSLSAAQAGDVIAADLTGGNPFRPDHLMGIDMAHGDTSDGHNIWITQHSPFRLHLPLRGACPSSECYAHQEGHPHPHYRLLHIF